MSTKKHKHCNLKWAATAALACLATDVAGQDAGLETTLSFSQGLTYSDDVGTYGSTELGFEISSQTRTQVFDFQARTEIRQNFDGGSVLEINTPTLSIAYEIDSRQTAVTTELYHSQTDADTFVVDTELGPGILVFDDGTRENTGAAVGLDFGRENRFGGSFDVGFDTITYSDTTSTEFIDTDTTTANLELNFEIDRRITATLGYDWSDENRIAGRDVTTENLYVAAAMAVTQTVDADISIGVDRVTVAEAGAETINDGLTYGLSLTQDRPLGSLRISLESDLSEAGRRTTTNLGATFETRRGDLSADFGLSQGTDNSIRPVIALRYSEELPRGSYGIAIEQRFDTENDDGDETLNSLLQLTWQQDLTRTAQISTDLTYQITDVLGADEDTALVELGLSYTRDLTDDWALATRYTYSVRDQDGASTTNENELFIGLETRLNW